MFYGPRKWDLSTGVGWGWVGGERGILRALCVPLHTSTKAVGQKKGKKKKRSATECWVELMTPSPGLKYTNAGASQKRRREREQQIKSCSAPWFLFFTLTASPSLLSVCHICVCCFPDCLLIFFLLICKSFNFCVQQVISFIHSTLNQSYRCICVLAGMRALL